MKLLVSLLLMSCSGALVLPSRSLAAPATTRLLSSQSSTQQPVEELKHEIEDLKAEALRRMQALKLELMEADAAEKEKETEMDSVFSPQVAVSNVVHKEQKANRMEVQSTDETDLLDGTVWKVMLNIGREQDTWMPKTWGVSGERLLINVEVEFKREPLYEREEFLNGMANAKKLEVHHVDLGPTLSEDLRHVPFKKTGGWRVAAGEGPMGTDVLRFYIEIEQDVRHQGGDVYCPKGRVYCTCGYFPTHKPTGIQDTLRAEQDRLMARYNDLTLEMESAGVFDKIRISKEMLDIRMEAGKLGDQLNEARVREPEKSLLRLSRKGDVGLTKEGGVCCKVQKGLAIEYHILGKFGIASIQKRQNDLEENLMP
eukprot:CAMPEP_0202486780 /NCGR_PEP_ID=MMETSP1361-20130828/5259_1 /ASSEMBLY_ACC=CAM_ASM_000849 /TAXON_ID=210615 /ORGANISM="Staurosira complex sp., Strain CCMP2646" /LENGTH=369 /DNA_ID=CAMNT_0049116013 /DNA_START=10 /DNA_END=1119 /DNA_ORIENTATION=-